MKEKIINVGSTNMVTCHTIKCWEVISHLLTSENRILDAGLIAFSLALNLSLFALKSFRAFSFSFRIRGDGMGVRTESACCVLLRQYSNKAA